MNKMKKKLLFLLTLTLSLTISSVVAFAETNTQASEQPTVETSSDNSNECKSSDDESDDEKVRIRRSANNSSITLSICEIEKLSSIYVEGTCETDANKVVDEIGYTLTFEKLQNGRWVSIGSVTNSVKNSYSIENSHLKKVTKGASYRVRATHYIVNDGEKSTDTSVSDSIYVN